MFEKRLLVLCLGLFAATLSYNVLQVHAAPGDGIYTADQAARGSKLYAAKCQSCHGDDLDGLGAIPPLDNAEFLSHFAGQPISVLFDKTQTTMPGDNPGSLARQETADIIAFILSTNKLPAGTTELPTDADALKKIQLTAPAKH